MASGDCPTLPERTRSRSYTFSSSATVVVDTGSSSLNRISKGNMHLFYRHCGRPPPVLPSSPHQLLDWLPIIQQLHWPSGEVVDFLPPVDAQSMIDRAED